MSKNTRPLSRRDFLRGAGLAGLGVAFAAAGCQPKTVVVKEEVEKVVKETVVVKEEVEKVVTATPPPAEMVNIVYWHSWTEQWEEMTQFVCDSFNESFPGIHAEQVVIPGAERTTKFLSSVAAGNPPDMITVYSAMGIPSFVEQNAVLPLENEEDIAAAKEWFHPAVLEMGTYEGKVWGLSYWQQTACIGWNKKAFDEVGLDRDTPPTTIEELDMMAEKLTKMDGDRIDRMGHMPSYHWMWAAAWGGSFYDDIHRRITANDPAIVDMFEWMASYSEQYDVTRVLAFQEGLASERAGILDPFISGRIAIHEVGGAWKLGDFRKYAEEGFEFGIAPSPNPPGQSGVSTYSYGDFTLVPRGTEHPDAAWQFVKYTGGLGGTLEDYMKVLTWGGRPINVPVTTQILDYAPFQQVVADYPGFQEMIDMFLKGDRVGIPPKLPVGSFYDGRLNAARDKVRLLEMTPQEAMDEVTEEVQKELDDFYASK